MRRADFYRAKWLQVDGLDWQLSEPLAHHVDGKLYWPVTAGCNRLINALAYYLRGNLWNTSTGIDLS